MAKATDFHSEVLASWGLASAVFAGSEVCDCSGKERAAISSASSTLASLYFAERSVQQLHGVVHVALGGVEHGRHANRITEQAAFADQQAVVARPLHHLVSGFRRGFFGLEVFHQFERLHQA